MTVQLSDQRAKRVLFQLIRKVSELQAVTKDSASKKELNKVFLLLMLLSDLYDEPVTKETKKEIELASSQVKIGLKNLGLDIQF